MKPYLIVSFLLCLGLSLACSSDGDSSQQGLRDDVEAIERSKIKSVQGIQPLPVAILEQAFPANIPEAKSLPPTGGRQTSGSRVLIKAEREYIFHSAGNVRISIADYTDLKEYKQPFQAQYDAINDDDEYFSRFEEPEGKGVIYWDLQNRSGTVRFLALDRFGIVIELESVPQGSLLDPRVVFSLVNFNALKLAMES